jgi:hypothetical protein
MSDKVPFGFWGEVLGLFNIFNVNPLIMSIPTIEAQYGIAIPVHTAVQKNRALAFWALAVNLHIVSQWVHSCSDLLIIKPYT